MEIEQKSKKDLPVNLDKEFSSEFFNPTINLSIDYAEIFIDEIVENEVLKDIPIVKSVLGIVKTGISINHLFFTKKILTFLKEFHKGNIKPEKLEQFKKEINDDHKYRKKVTEQIMIFNDRFIEISKSKISANLLVALVNKSITYDQFVSLNITLDRLHPDSFYFLAELNKNKYKLDEDIKWDDRNHVGESMLKSGGLGIETSSFAHGFQVNEAGKSLFELGIKPILKSK